MSSDSLPISPSRFAEAIKDLSAASLALKVAELRNSIAHLDYSNAELKPFAEGTAADAAAPGPDPDCADAIRENEAVISRMQERIELVRAEVEGRGLNWQEFSFKQDETTPTTTEGSGESNAVNAHVSGVAESNGDEGIHDLTGARMHGLVNGARAPNEAVNGHGGGASGTLSQEHSAWRDGTFQTGTIRGLSDEDIIRGLTERVPGFGISEGNRDNRDDEEDETGLHL